MPNLRLIARLDIKGQNLIKTIQLEGMKIIGNPSHYAKKYYKQGADELIYIDTVASLYERNHLLEIIRETVKDVFIPITVGGGIRSLDDAASVLRSGADKVALNSSAIKNPSLLTKIADRFGSQSVVLSIEAKRISENQWEAYYYNGRERSGIDVLDWASRASELGVGEILLTSIDREGTGRGFDVELIKIFAKTISTPIIASGGIGKISDVIDLAQINGIDGIAMAGLLHFNQSTIDEIRSSCQLNQIKVREF